MKIGFGLVLSLIMSFISIGYAYEAEEMAKKDVVIERRKAKAEALKAKKQVEKRLFIQKITKEINKTEAKLEREWQSLLQKATNKAPTKVNWTVKSKQEEVSQSQFIPMK